MGVGGAGGAESPAARRSADLVLTDADLTRLVDAIAEGRAMWARVRDAVAVLVGGNAGEVAFTVVGTALGGRSPLGTRQLLLVNLLTDMFPALAVAVAAPAPHRGPRREIDPDDPLAGHPLAEELRAGPLHGFTRVRPPAGAGPRRGHGGGRDGAWATGRLTGSRGRAGSMGLAALIGTQLAQTAWAGRRSPLVLVTAAGSFAVLAAVVQTPGREPVLRLPPAGPGRVGDGAGLVGGRGGGGGAGAAVAGVVAGRPRSRNDVAGRWPSRRPRSARARTRRGRPTGRRDEPGAGVTTTGAGVPAADPT